MAFYRVKWEIDIDAASPEEAARLAKDVQLSEDRVVDVFEVKSYDTGVIKLVDLVEK